MVNKIKVGEGKNMEGKASCVNVICQEVDKVQHRFCIDVYCCWLIRLYFLTFVKLID